jgi:D-alanine-D-alanine ligase
MPTATPQRRMLSIAFVTEYREDYLAKGWGEEQTTGFDWRADSDTIAASIETLGHKVERVGNIESLAKRVAEGTANWDLVWNFSEGNTLHEAREAQVPSLLEAFNIPFTFSDAATMALLMNKAKSKVSVRRILYHMILRLSS